MLLRSLAVLSTLLATSRAARGGQICASIICVNALVNGQTVTYQLVSQLGFEELGWMAIGFGSLMPDTPMVITWPNEDGTITLSQRQAPAHIMPTVVANPAQKATLSWDYSILATNTTTIAFTHPVLTSSSLSSVPLIWAYSSERPSSSSPDAALVQHDNMGSFSIDLTQSMDALPSGTPAITTVVGTSTQVIHPTPTHGTGSGNNGGNTTSHLTPSQMKIRTHGILMSVGFLVFLPLGIFIARFSRTVPVLKNKWFTAHWFVQFILSGPIIFAGWALGYQYAGDVHFQDPHTRAGLALLILYLVQMTWGTIIHFFKPTPKPLPSPLTTTDAAPTSPVDVEKSSTTRLPISQSALSHSPESSDEVHGATTVGAHSTMGLRGQNAVNHHHVPSEGSVVPAIKARPPQNYGHALLGLSIIALAFYNVHEGYSHEWSKVFGSGRRQVAFLNFMRSWWISWVVIIPCIYLIGLTLLPRQWKQETDARRARSKSASA